MHHTVFGVSGNCNSDNLSIIIRKDSAWRALLDRCRVGMSNGRDADHVTLPAICRLYSIADYYGRFPSSTFALSAFS